MRLVNDQHPDTIQWARHYAQYPVAFRQMLARSEPFLWYIVEAVEGRSIPAEIALLPAVESSFDPHARSPQKAHGLWQFVPWTGRALGLHSGRHYDARRDPIESTQAALGYLDDLHERFGDWHLALAAYNSGAARLSKLLRNQSSAGDFWDLQLPRETYEHVRRLMGIALLIEKPRQFGVELPPIRNRHAAELIRLDQPINLSRAARRAQVSETLIRQYNPGLQTLSHTTGKRLLALPPAEAARLRETLAAHEFRPEPIPSVVVHMVEPGDSLWRIARRYAVSVRDLARQNNISEKAVLRPGRRLEVPIST